VGGDAVEQAIAAAASGRPILLPTDTVYGLATSAERADYAADLYRLKGRVEIQPTAIVAASIDALVAALPELDDRSRSIAATLLPGPFTLVLPNPPAPTRSGSACPTSRNRRNVSPTASGA
jgi:L-threonylcarbamoyladenylate synthase